MYMDAGLCVHVGLCTVCDWGLYLCVYIVDLLFCYVGDPSRGCTSSSVCMTLNRKRVSLSFIFPIFRHRNIWSVEFKVTQYTALYTSADDRSTTVGSIRRLPSFRAAKQNEAGRLRIGTNK